MKPFRQEALLLLLLWTLSGCGADGSAQKQVESSAPDALVSSSEKEDHILSTLSATVDEGRTLTLQAIGKQRTDLDEWGVREVRVYDGESLLQTLSVQDAIEAGGIDGIEAGYTSCWSVEEAMTIHDMNFDGYDDLDLFGWSPNNTIPHYYWLWDQETQRYQFAFILQGAEADPESQEIRATVKSFGGDGPEGGFYQTNIYRYVDFGELALVRREVMQIRDGKSLLEVYQVTDGQFHLVETREAPDGTA